MVAKQKTVVLLAGLILIGATLLWAAPTQINNLWLSRENGFTVLTIEGTSPIRYAHQSVEAKEGKPFRIVVDCLASRHALPQREFTDLPTSVITAIRTSQYAVDPEEVVRVVLDLTGESIYRVETNQSTLRVFIADEATTPLPEWTCRMAVETPSNEVTPTVQTVATVQPTTVASTEEQPTTAEPSELPVTEPAVTAPTPTAQSEPLTSAPVVPMEITVAPVVESTPITRLAPPPAEIVYGPQTPTLAVTSKPVAETPTVSQAPLVVNDQPTATQPAPNPAQNTPVETQTVAALSGTETTVPAPGVVPPGSATVANDVHMAPKATREPVTTETMPTPEDVADYMPAADTYEEAYLESEQTAKTPGTGLAVVPDENSAATPESEEARRSRFRRETAKAAELKATQVVQFPQRMLINYEQAGMRDPFKPLVELDNQKQHKSDLNAVPNVEALSLVGILKSVEGKGAALMEDVRGVGYILRTGDRVQNGFVSDINDHAISFQINEYGWDRMVVKEMTEDNDI